MTFHDKFQVLNLSEKLISDVHYALFKRKNAVLLSHKMSDYIQ